ncbi:MAG: hypothetical protein K0S61_1786 [Anaerocolumna sp.]|nr:hypothetical protein [Anaerocolumna sp.]
MIVNIPPVILVLLVIIITNCIISFSKSKILNNCYLVFSTFFSLVGILGIIMIRPRFLYILNRQEDLRNYEPNFITWAIEKFDVYAVCSITVNIALILCLLCYLLLNERKSGFIRINITMIVISIMFINFASCIWYAIGTINKLFDVASFISQISLAEFFALYIPLVVKRILVSKSRVVD